MEFRISDTFTASLTKLTGEEQKAVKTTAFDLQVNPANPGLKFHRLDRAQDRNFWSVRVSRDLRVIVHRTSKSLMLCYVDHHDDAYAWAERRRIERHPKTGAAQLVEIRETVRQVPVVQYVAEPAIAMDRPTLFDALGDEELLAYGVPTDWLDEVRRADEDTVLALAERLPDEAGEALLALAVGETPPRPVQLSNEADPFEHPDAQRRFRVMTNVEELERALDFPWERWSVFLHPDQRELVERSFDGAARVGGTAGTGKTVVALHRAVHLTRAHQDARVLLTTFSAPLANALRAKVRRLVANEPTLAERLDVQDLASTARRLYEFRFGSALWASESVIRDVIAREATGLAEKRLTPAFLWKEWLDVVDAWQPGSWEEYRDLPRLGRRVRLSETQREKVWAVCTAVNRELDELGVLTPPRLFRRLGQTLAEEGTHPYRFIVVDEAQDVGVAQLRLLSVLAGDPDTLFFTGDLGQRIFRPPFSWKALGVDVRGRSHTLRVNYRTSHQIRQQVDRLLPLEIGDVDGVTENRTGVVSVFNGPLPTVETFTSHEDEAARLGAWLSGLIEHGIPAEELAVFVRSEGQITRASAALDAAEISSALLGDDLSGQAGHVSVGTMHQAKGLEFRGVAVIACDDEIIPLQERIESVGEQAELEEVYRTERQLLYVACTRAREHLLVTGVEPASEFLEDMGTSGT